MKSSKWVLYGLALIAVTRVGYGEDRTGALGLNYTVGPSFIAGGSNARDVSSVEPGVGAALQFGLTRNLDFLFAYDYIDAVLRTQALTFGGQWRLLPDAVYIPFVGAGIGFGKPVSGVGWDHFSLKLTGGVEKALTSAVSLAGVISYQYVNGPEPFGSVHTIEPGVRLIYYFGSLRKT